MQRCHTILRWCVADKADLEETTPVYQKRKRRRKQADEQSNTVVILNIYNNNCTLFAEVLWPVQFIKLFNYYRKDLLVLDVER